MSTLRPLAPSRHAFRAALAVPVLLCAILIGRGPKGALEALALALFPPLVYLTLVQPLLFPYGLYLLLLPFDNILVLGHTATVTRLLGEFSGVALLIWCLRKRTIAQPQWSLAALGGLFAWMMMSAFWAPDQQESLNYVKQYAALFGMYAAVAIFPITLKQFQALLHLCAVAGVLAAAYGAYLFYQHPSLAANDPTQRLFIGANAPAIDPNNYADSLLLPAAAFIIFTLRAAGFWQKLVCLGGLGITATGLLLSASREAAIALAVMLVYVTIRSTNRRQMIVVAAALTCAGFLERSQLWNRFTEGSPRSSIWAVGMEAFKHNWLTGTGIGSFIDTYNHYYLQVAQFNPDGFSRPAHNIVLHYGVELGIVGLGLIVWFIGAHFRELRFILPPDPAFEDRVLVECAIVGVLVAALFIDLFTYKYFWLTMTLAAALRNALLNERKSSAKRAHDDVAPVSALHKGAATLA